VVEDAAQAHCAALDGRPVGCWGDVAAFSFYPTKNMTTGEGGMIVTGDTGIAERARLLRNQGMEVQYRNEIAGFNMRLTDMAAAIGRVQLGRLPQLNASRIANAAELTRRLASVPNLITPGIAAGARHVFHQYTVRVPGRDEVLRRLHTADVEARVYYPTPVHELPAYGEEVNLPATREDAATVLSLPVGPHLSAGDLERVADATSAAVGRAA
jgi:dTDP-4-amino-4,6-dideoxygalactose transaminase